MKPYKNLNSKNLGLLLLMARISAVFGVFLLVLTGVVFLFGLFGGGVQAFSSIALLPASLGAIFFSGVSAAIVAFEENYRLRTEHILKNKEI